jgi:hypothetical protein
LTITTTTLPDAKVGKPYNVTLAASGGSTPYRWTVVDALPAGLTLDSATGVLSGRAATAGTYGFTVRVTDTNGASDDQAYTLKVVTVGHK